MVEVGWISGGYHEEETPTLLYRFMRLGQDAEKGLTP